MTARSQKAEIINPLTIVEEYAREELVQRSEEFLEAAGRVIATWGTSHEERVAVFVNRMTDVTDAASYEQMAEWLKEGAQREKEIAAFFEPRKSLGFTLHRMICNRETAVVDRLRGWMRRGKDSWDRYRRLEEQKRRDEEQRLADIARKAEQERLAREAELLEQRGEHAVAAQVLEQAVHTPAPVFTVPSSLPDVKGVTARENWKWRPIGGDTPQARARAVQMVPREFLCLDEKKLNAYAKAHGASARVPGLEFYDAGSVAVRV